MLKLMKSVSPVLKAIVVQKLDGLMNSSNPQAATDTFHRLYYNSRGQTYNNTYWLGTKTQKCPLDLWIYQELIFKLKPDVIVECGTNMGGSALFLANMCDLINNGRVLSIDIVQKDTFPIHPRIQYLTASSTSASTQCTVREITQQAKVVLVILDSDHSEQHVREELNFYSTIVTKGSYLIVEDTNLNGHPVYPSHGPGPMEAVRSFLPSRPDFVIDPECEKFFLTFNPRGYLRRVA